MCEENFADPGSLSVDVTSQSTLEHGEKQNGKEEVHVQWCQSDCWFF